MNNFPHRSDIDGLRGIAVLLVIIYHAGIFFPGGFIGVDVFFVISGYVITGLILKQQRSHKFDLAEFWIRRIRRILPASMLVVIVSLLAGAIILFPTDFETLAISAFYQQIMAANFFFWLNTGYFDGPAELNPLLHTWSLAVEEQFYLIYPFLLVLLRKSTSHRIASVIGLLILASFTISHWGINNHPNAAFYLLPSRAWEILIGGILCFIPTPLKASSYRTNILSIIGIFGILWPAVAYNSDTTFPGASALIPCIGTALVIYANSYQTTLIGAALALKPIVFLGQISYSLYLWHWPLLVFLKFLLVEPPTELAIYLTLLVCFLLSLLSWRYIELPFRNGSYAAGNKHLLLGIFTTSVVILCASFVIGKKDGFPSRISSRAMMYRTAGERADFIKDTPTEKIRSEDLPRFGDPSGEVRCLVWGDSHAIALMPCIDEVCKAHQILGYQATYRATPPILDFVKTGTTHGLNERASAWNQAIFDFASKHRVDAIVVAGFWKTYAGNPSFAKRFSASIQRLSTLGSKIIVMRDVPYQSGNIPLMLAKATKWRRPTENIGISLTEHRKSNETIDHIIDKLSHLPNVIVLDPAPLLVDEKNFCRGEIGGEALYRDEHHLTIEGSLRLTSLFENALTASGK